MGQKKLGYGLLVSGLALTAVACGGGGSPAAGYTSAAALKSAMASPTGEVSAETAVGVAAAFESGSTSGLSAGLRQKAQAQSGSIACSEGGTISYSGNQNMAVASYNNCGEGGCVLNGNMNILASSVTETAVSACISADVNAVCLEEGTVSMQFSMCMDTDTTAGTVEIMYLVEYDGETYAVTGSYSAGSGSLTITGSNGSYTCTYTAEAGSCTGSDGSSFEFTASSGSEDVEG